MNQLHALSKNEGDDTRVLWWSAILAFVVEGVLLTAVGFQEHWIAHPQKTTGLDPEKFIEAQVFQMPAEAHLVEEKTPTVPIRHEATLSKVAGQGKSAPQSATKTVEENQTLSGDKISANHGPVVIFSPAPVIPEFLRDRELKKDVAIDFFVTAQGGVIPRLVNSSGDEELDAIAVAAAKKWQFRPAEQDHRAVDAKVRLRIVFEVK